MSKEQSFIKIRKNKRNIWKVRNFTNESSLNGNLSSGPLRDWDTLGIVGIKLEIE